MEAKDRGFEAVQVLMDCLECFHSLYYSFALITYTYLSFVLLLEAIGAVFIGALGTDVVVSSTYVAHLVTLGVCGEGGGGRGGAVR